MKRIWFIVTLSSLIALCFINPENILNSMLNAGETSVKLTISLLGIYAIWMGILQIVEDTGMSTILAFWLSPLIDFLFGKVPNNARKLIATNMSANILGMGNACTPTGIKAMNELDKVNTKPTASTAMIMLVVINATSIQLLPTTVIGLRVVHGSTSASDIIIPTLISTLLSTAIAIILVKIFSKSKKLSKL